MAAGKATFVSPTVAADLASRLGSPTTARAWLAEVVEYAPADLATQRALAAVSVGLEARLPGAALPGARGDLDRAVAHAEWQIAYDAAMALPLGTPSALARLLVVAEGLAHQGAPEAALDLLGRALDAYTGVPDLYALLARVLTTLGRHDDAQMALDLLRQCQ